MSTPDTPLERRIRTLLVAYPPRWREERSDELVGTALDLARDGQRWPGPRLVVDLLVGGWRTRASEHLAAVGPLAAGWRLATTSAVLALAAVTLVWLRDWVRVGHQPLLPNLGGASAVTYVLALVLFLAATATWLGGRARVTRWLAGTALACWALTAIVFTALSNNLVGGWTLLAMDLTPPLVWTFLAAVATAGLWQPRPAAPRGVAVVVVLALVGAAITSTGAVAPGSTSTTTMYRAVGAETWGTAILDRSPFTLHTVLRVSWVVVALGGLATVRVDPRPVVAATWLAPFLLMDHLWFGGPVGMVSSVAAIVSAVVVALLMLRSTSPAGPHHEA